MTCLTILGISVGHLQFVHEAVIYLHGLWVILYFLHALSIKLAERGLFSQFLIAVCIDAVRVKAKHIAVWNTIGDGVLMEHVTKQRFGHNLVVGILLKYWSSSKPEEQGTWECALDALKHFAEYRTVTLINDEDQTFLAYAFYHCRINAWPRLDV